MNNALDSLGVGNFARFQSNASTTTILSAGVLSVAGPYWDMQRDGIDASGSHTLVMNGTSPQTVYAYQGGSSRILNNVRVSGTGSVDFYYAAKAIGAFEVTSATTVTAGQGGGAFHITGVVNVAAGATLNVPDGSTFSALMTVNGTVRFAGASTSTSDLDVQATGAARALTTNATKFVDFSSILVSSGGTLDNLSTRASAAGGFRYSATYNNGGTLIGPAPTTT